MPVPDALPPAAVGGRLGWLRGPRTAGSLRRSTDDRLAGGVAAGVAARTGFDLTLVRIVFVVAALATGVGAAVYVVGWLFVPAERSDHTIAGSALTDRRGIALAAGIGSLLVVLLLVASAFGAAWLGSVSWPLVISVAGLVLIWRNASADERATLRRLAQPFLDVTGTTGAPADARTGPRTALRMVVAGLLLAGGAVALLVGHASRVPLRPLAGVLLVLAAIVVVLGPWWLRIARDLVLERQARARAEERADMAARVHDSVLQTLALIQRRADEPGQVVALARAQERELRSWLFEGRAPGALDEAGLTLSAGIRGIQRDVEAQRGVTVEVVVVGDCVLDDDLRALLAAAREATVNAAKWAGVAQVSLFAEVEPTRVSVFVRDRGRGFDPAAVPGDRLGLAESVHARMARRGGTATVRTAPGAGTEVSLVMTRTAGTARRPRPGADRASSTPLSSRG